MSEDNVIRVSLEQQENFGFVMHFNDAQGRRAREGKRFKAGA